MACRSKFHASGVCPFLTLLLMVASLPALAAAGDWPTWRYDATRSASTPDPLPDQMHLQWVRQLAPPRPAWPPSQETLDFDLSYEPVSQGGRLFVGSMATDSITAYDTATGEELWRFYTDGPVRFAPVVDGPRLYAVSDDGYLYCLASDSGSLLWKYHGAPDQRPILGNERLISTWPARGGPVLADGKVCFTTSIWPSMGIFIHAVDAETGERVWLNDRVGSDFTVHPHGAPSFGSVVPQGYLATANGYLIVPGGRSLPAVFDLETGELVHFDFGGKSSGGYNVMASDEYYFVRREMFRLADGAKVGDVHASLLADGYMIGSQGAYGPILLHSLAGEVQERTRRDRRGRQEKLTIFEPSEKSEIEIAGAYPAAPFIKTGHQVFGGADSTVVCLDLSKRPAEGEKLKPSWSARTRHSIWNMLAADDRLFVVTKNGMIYCYGAEEREPRHYEYEPREMVAPQGRGAELVRSALAKVEVDGAYTVVLGIGSGDCVDALLSESTAHVIVVDPDAGRVEALRRRADDAGLYGTRIAAFAAEPTSFPLPPYLASLIVVPQPEALDLSGNAAALGLVFEALRPYGGVLCLPLDDEQHAALAHAVKSAALDGADLRREGALTLLSRVGPLPGAGYWTHQYADSTNSVVSSDQRVKAPLGILWFGGPDHDGILPRHGHGPSPQVAGGRIVIEGADFLRALDVYTGRLLWQTELPGVGNYYNTTSHFPGAGEIGSNYVTLPDNIYVVYGDKLLKLDAATGKIEQEIGLTASDDEPEPAWGVALVWEDLLIATSSPVVVEDEKEPTEGTSLGDVLTPARYAAASRRLVVLNRHTGQQLWSRDAAFNFRHNCIVAAAGKIFCIDGMNAKKLEALQRRGIQPERSARLLALDAFTGSEIWSTDEDVFGTFLNYSLQHDVLLQGGSLYRDRAQDEVGSGLVAYRGEDGHVLWKDLELRYNGPCLLWRDKIITNGGGGFQLELLTGERTGWQYARMYGCNTVVGSQNLLTFRSGAAAFCDLLSDSGTANIGGFRSSCTSNLIVADGVLSAPEYTRTCTCAYQLQTSLALVHMPEAELWAFNRSIEDDQLARRLGVNLGAPGDRRAVDGTLWLEHPDVGGPSPSLPLKIEPKEPEFFRRHASAIAGPGLTWVGASGAKGIERLTLTLPGRSRQPHTYTVRLYFAEPDDLQPGQRRFSVQLQDETVLTDLDVVAEAAGPRRVLVKEFPGVTIADELHVAMQPSTGATVPQTLLNGLEVILEEQADK